MAHAKPSLGLDSEQLNDGYAQSEHCARVQPEYVAVFNSKRKLTQVSPSFCKLLGYTEEELLGRRYDDITVPRTNHIPMTLKMLVNNGYQFGIWVLAHRSGTKLFIRYETFARSDDLFEARMELLAAGA
jgi:PAS domain S-box-containing protein